MTPSSHALIWSNAVYLFAIIYVWRIGCILYRRDVCNICRRYQIHPLSERMCCIATRDFERSRSEAHELTLDEPQQHRLTFRTIHFWRFTFICTPLRFSTAAFPALFVWELCILSLLPVISALHHACSDPFDTWNCGADAQSSLATMDMINSFTSLVVPTSILLEMYYPRWRPLHALFFYTSIVIGLLFDRTYDILGYVVVPIQIVFMAWLFFGTTPRMRHWMDERHHTLPIPLNGVGQEATVFGGYINPIPPDELTNNREERRKMNFANRLCDWLSSTNTHLLFAAIICFAIAVVARDWAQEKRDQNNTEFHYYPLLHGIVWHLATGATIIFILHIILRLVGAGGEWGAGGA